MEQIKNLEYKAALWVSMMKTDYKTVHTLVEFLCKRTSTHIHIPVGGLHIRLYLVCDLFLP
jgi:hypothetical protein